MGAPAGHPYAHPEGVCINGLGALPSPYGPTLRGAHNGPSGLQKKYMSGIVCPNRNLGQINRKQGLKLRLVCGWGCEGSPCALVAGVVMCSCCTLALPKLNPKLSRINCKLQLYRLWFNPTWIYGYPLRPTKCGRWEHMVRPRRK